MSAHAVPLDALIRQIPTFSAIPDGVLADLIEQSRVVEFVSGDRLIGQFEASDFAMILLSGQAAVVNESQHGQTPLAQIAAPALLGEIGALGRLRRTASVLATSPVRALRVERAVLLDVCRHAPDILLSVVGQLGAHIEKMNGALGLYANGLAALEQEDFNPAILDDLSNPIPEMRGFGAAFEKFARHITRERRRRDEMASAALLQRAMLPQRLDTLPLAGRCSVFGDMRPAREVGGDFYDAFMLDDRRIVLAIGDVCGKGVPASLFMSMTMTTLRLAAYEPRPLAPTLELVNALLYEQNPTMMFATLFYGILDLETGAFDYAIGGHNPPFVLRRDGSCTQLPSGGSPLAILPEGRFGFGQIQLAPGDGIFLYTDGVTESLDAMAREYGDDRLAATLTRCQGFAAQPLVAAVIADVDGFASGVDQFDDITCLAVRFGA